MHNIQIRERQGSSQETALEIRKCKRIEGWFAKNG